MKLYFRGEFFDTVNNQEEADKLIEEYQKYCFSRYQAFKALYAGTISCIEKIREKGLIETNPEYWDYVSENYPGVLAGIEKIGDMILPDGYDSIYFYNSHDFLLGYKKDGAAIPISLIPLKAALYFPKKDEFYVEEA